jgi:transposase-like protein
LCRHVVDTPAAELVVASTDRFNPWRQAVTAIHSEAFIEQALVKVHTRGARTIESVATDLNVSYHTLKYWMKKTSRPKGDTKPAPEKRPQDWSAAEQLAALQETHGLSGEALQAWCREHGIFAHHLTSWKQAFCAQGAQPAAGQHEVRTLKDENARLKRDLVRKDRALAEAAALLVLQKKFRALWEDEAS